MQHVAPVHIRTITRPWLNDYWEIIVYWHLYIPNDLPNTGIRRTYIWDFTFNLMAVDPNIKVMDLHLAAADPRLEVVDLKQEVPERRSGGIPQNLTPAPPAFPWVRRTSSLMKGLVIDLGQFPRHGIPRGSVLVNLDATLLAMKSRQLFFSQFFVRISGIGYLRMLKSLGGITSDNFKTL